MSVTAWAVEHRLHRRRRKVRQSRVWSIRAHDSSGRGLPGMGRSDRTNVPHTRNIPWRAALDGRMDSLVCSLLLPFVSERLE